MKFLSINGKRIKTGELISDIKGDQFMFLYLCDGERKIFCKTLGSMESIMPRIFYPSVFNAIILEDDDNIIPKEERPTTAFNRSKMADKYGDKDDI